MKKVVFFTNSFPFGIKELWKASQIEALAGEFDDVLVAPLHFGRDRTPAALPDRVRVVGPLLETEGARFKRSDLLRIVNPRLRIHLRALLAGLLASDAPRAALRQWATDALKVERIVRDRKIWPALQKEMEGAVLYFFWGKGWADVLPFLAPSFRKRSAVRFHGYDLYRERFGNFIPYQREIVSSASLLLLVSRNGIEYMRREYSACTRKLAYAPLGTRPTGRAAASADGRFRLVSCAFVGEVKRLDLVVRALPLLDRSFSWTHIGDGPGLDSLRELAEGLGVATRCRFMGHIPSHEIGMIYSANAFDLFLNVSFSEGLPVAVMEALGAGIPVLATDVGGNRELVDESVGGLMERDLTPEALARHIQRMREKPREELQRLRAAAVDRQEGSYDSRRNAKAAAVMVANL